MDIKIVFHPSGDWEGLYLDDALWNEGHSIYTESLITALTNYIKAGKPIDDIQYDVRDLGNEEGFDAEDFSFPLKYEDIDGNKSKD